MNYFDSLLNITRWTDVEVAIRENKPAPTAKLLNSGINFITSS